MIVASHCVVLSATPGPPCACPKREIICARLTNVCRHRVCTSNKAIKHPARAQSDDGATKPSRTQYVFPSHGANGANKATTWQHLKYRKARPSFFFLPKRFFFLNRKRSHAISWQTRFSFFFGIKEHTSRKLRIWEGGASIIKLVLEARRFWWGVQTNMYVSQIRAESTK